MDELPTQVNRENAPNHQSDPHAHHIVLTDATVNEEEERDSRKTERKRKLRKAPPWIEAACAILLVVITGSYTYYAARQANAAKKTAKAAFDAIEEAKRDNIATIKAQQKIAQTALTKTQENFVASTTASARQFSDTLKQMQAQTRTQGIAADASLRAANSAERNVEATQEASRSEPASMGWGGRD